MPGLFAKAFRGVAGDARSGGKRLGGEASWDCSEPATICADPSALKTKAGEYSEEDTHRPAHHYREVVARRTFRRSTGQSADATLEKETLETRKDFTTGHLY